MTHWAVFGINAMALTEKTPFTISATTDDGQLVSFVSSVQVVDGDYEFERITFTPQVNKLLDPAITEPELERLSEVYGSVTPARLWDGLWIWPFEGPITSQYGTRRDYGGVLDSYHSGIDIDGVTGDTVVAAASGVVALAEKLEVRGNAVIIDHGAGVLSGYYHLDVADVVVGQRVAQGDTLGVMGSTGLSTGSHLHWELRIQGVAVNPSQWTTRLYPNTYQEEIGE